MDIGFTGTRAGMSQAQRDQLAFVLGIFSVPAGQPFHYGTHGRAKLLADEQARDLALRFGFVPVPHHALSGRELQRNREQVAAIDILIAAPETDTEQLRSGTWATVRYARAAGKPVVMLSRGKS